MQMQEEESDSSKIIFEAYKNYFFKLAQNPFMPNEDIKIVMKAAQNIISYHESVLPFYEELGLFFESFLKQLCLEFNEQQPSEHTSQQSDRLKNQKIIAQYSKIINSIKFAIYYYAIPFEILHSRLIEELYKTQPVTVTYKQPLNYNSILLSFVHKIIGSHEQIRIATIIQQLNHAFRKSLTANEQSLQDINIIFSFYHCLQYHDKVQLIRKDDENGQGFSLVWKVPSQKTANYIEFFETPYLHDVNNIINRKIKKFYQKQTEKRVQSFAECQNKQRGYEQFIQWVSDSIAFEKRVAFYAYKFSEKEMLSLIKKKLLEKDKMDLILNHSFGPNYMLEQQLYIQLENIIKIILIDQEGIKKLGEIFRNFLQEKSKTAISKWTQLEKIPLPEAQKLYQETQALLSEANVVCDLLKDFDCNDTNICRSELRKARDSAFNHILSYVPGLIEAIALLVDDQIRQGRPVQEMGCQLAYFLSVYGNRSVFFKLYNRMLCLRMMDNCQKYYAQDKELVEIIQNTIISGEIIEILKVLQDGLVSNMVSENLVQNQEYLEFVRHQIKKTRVLLINESTLNFSSSFWYLPQKVFQLQKLQQAKNEWVRRRKFHVEKEEKNFMEVYNKLQAEPEMEEEKQIEPALPPPPPQPKKKAPAKRGRKQKNVMEEEVLPEKVIVPVEIPPVNEQTKPEEANLFCNGTPACIQKLYWLSDEILKAFKEKRYISYPLVSLGTAEVLFHARDAKYYLQVSSCQMILLLMIEEKRRKITFEEFAQVAQCEIEEDVKLLVSIGILLQESREYIQMISGNELCVNLDFSNSACKKIRCRPKEQVEQKKEDYKEKMLTFQDVCQVAIVKIMKQQKSMFLKELVELTSLKLSQKFVCYRDQINLQVQQMLREAMYIKVDENDVQEFILNQTILQVESQLLNALNLQTNTNYYYYYLFPSHLHYTSDSVVSRRSTRNIPKRDLQAIQESIVPFDQTGMSAS